MISYPLFVFNSRNVERERIVRRSFEGLKENLKKLRAITEDFIKLEKEAYGMKGLRRYDYESVKKEVLSFRPISRDND